MKSQIKHISRKTLAMVLCVLMVFSTMLVGTLSTANAATVTSDGTAILYFNMSAVSWWDTSSANGGNFAYFFNDSTNAWSSKATQVTGDYYYVTIPEGSWTTVILTRNSVTSDPSWSNYWNQTDNITLQADQNYISSFSEGSSTATWSTYQPTATVSVTPSATEVETGEEVTLTPAIATYSRYNDILSTSYSVDEGATVSDDGVFTATDAGEYTVTATVTYNAKGYTNITSEATATTTITVTENESSSTTEETTTEEPTEATTETTTEEPTEEPTDPDTSTGVYLVGEFNSWVETANEFVKEDASSTVGYVTVDLDAETDYKFKVLDNGTWLGNNGTMTSTNCSGWTFRSGSDYGNCTITTTIAGTYTFAYDTDTNKVSVTYPEEEPTSEETEETTATETETETTTEEPTSDTNIYVVKTDDWDVYAYAWTSGSSDQNADWPGVAATLYSTDYDFDIYSYDVASYGYVIFSNNGSSQSANITCADNYGKYYVPSAAALYDTLEEALEAAASTVTYDYVVAGESGLCGVNWDPTSALGGMTDNGDGTYTKVYTGISANTYEYKVTDGSWTNSWPSGNASVTVDVDGSTVTITFDSDSKEVTSTVTAPETTYTVVYTYTDQYGTSKSYTKTVTTTETDAETIATNNVPGQITDPMYDYTVGEVTTDDTTINVTLDGTVKDYYVTVDGTEYGPYYYKEEVTVTLSDGTEYTLYVTGDVTITGTVSDTTQIQYNGMTVTDDTVYLDLLSTAYTEDFARMGVAFAVSEKTDTEVADAVAAVESGTATSNGIAVHNSTVDAANASGYYQFTYAPYLSSTYATKTLYFYTYVVDTDGNVTVSSAVTVDLTNAYA